MDYRMRFTIMEVLGCKCAVGIRRALCVELGIWDMLKYFLVGL